MRGRYVRLMAVFIAITLCSATPAGATVKVVFGSSWDGPANELQLILDALYGSGQIDVHTDFLGARPDDPDPWFWLDDQFTSVLLKEVAGNATRNQVGWYEETWVRPSLKNDGVHDGLVFDGPAQAGASVVVTFAKPMTRFGFYMNPNGPYGATNAPEPELFFTNRTYNDPGPDGSVVLHQPYGGDVQALVFDLSRIRGTNTWLVCFEDLDSGANPGPIGQAQTDNDFNDLVFEVTAFGATPVTNTSIGALKARYTH